MWEGRWTTKDIVVDCITSGDVERHLGTSNDNCDLMIIRGMVTQHLVIRASDPPSFYQLPLTGLFRQLRGLLIQNAPGVEIRILPDLEQIEG